MRFDVVTARDLLRSLGRREKSWAFLALDLAVVPPALLLALSVAPLPAELPEVGQIMLVATPYLLMLSAIVFISLGINAVPLLDFDGTAFGRVAAAAIYVSAGAMALGMLAGYAVPSGVVLVFGMGLFIAISVGRIVLLQVVLAIYRRGSAICRVLIYGAGTTGAQLVQAFRSHRGIDPVAFVDDNPQLHGRTVANLPVLPPVRIAELVRRKGIDRVLLAVPSLSQPKQVRLARSLQKLGLEVQTLPSFSQLIGTEALIDKLEPVAASSFLGRAEESAPLGPAAATYAGKSVLVSGAGGSIGSDLCRQLIGAKPRRLVLFELSEYALFTVERELAPMAHDAGIEIVPVLGSVLDEERVRQVLTEREVEVVLHAAAYKHVRLVQMNPLAGLANNVLGTQVLAVEAVRAGVERFILVSSDKAVRPRGVMGASKRLAELVIQDLANRVPEGEGPVFSLVRFGNVLGSSGSVVPIFNEQIRRGGPVTVTHPEVTRYFMTIPEAVGLVLRAGAMARGGRGVPLGHGPSGPHPRPGREGHRIDGLHRARRRPPARRHRDQVCRFAGGREARGGALPRRAPDPDGPREDLPRARNGPVRDRDGGRPAVAAAGDRGRGP
jgi:FlaA1/EpsC-like NDP-sugar epimerase